MPKVGGWMRARSRVVVVGSLVGLLCTPACSGNSSAPPPAVDDTARGARPLPADRAPAAPAQTGLSTRQKLVMLGGAAALYYLYRKHQASAAQGPEGQYYLSKNGRVYYRDAEHRAHWVTPPAQGIAVPESEARDYAQFQGYDNRPSGRDLVGLAADDNP